MKLFLGILVWIAMGAVIGKGLLMAVAGQGLWLAALSLLAFIVAVGAIGCRQ